MNNYLSVEKKKLFLLLHLKGGTKLRLLYKSAPKCENVRKRMPTTLQLVLQISSQTTMREEIFHRKILHSCHLFGHRVALITVNYNCSIVNIVLQTMACQYFSTINPHVRFVIF